MDILGHLRVTTMKYHSNIAQAYPGSELKDEQGGGATSLALSSLTYSNRASSASAMSVYT